MAKLIEPPDYQQLLKRYLQIERENGGARKQTLDLQKRKRSGRETGSKRMLAYTRIARGFRA